MKYAPERYRETLRRAAGADVVVKCGGVGACDRERGAVAGRDV